MCSSDLTGISFPVKITDVQKFANKNELIINVFGWNNESLDILHTDSRLYKIDLPVVNLLLYKGHYMWIKRMSALMYKQTKETHGGKLTCLRCLHHFGSERTLNEHIEKCLDLHDGKCLIKMPPEGSVVKFKNLMKMEKVPYVVYSDFESVMDKATGVHTACGFATHLVNSMG